MKNRVCVHDTDGRECVVVGIPKASDSFVFLGKRNQESGGDVAESLWKETKAQLRSEVNFSPGSRHPWGVQRPSGSTRTYTAFFFFFFNVGLFFFFLVFIDFLIILLCFTFWAMRHVES